MDDASNDPQAESANSPAVRALLAQDPFILYLDETDAAYHVRSGTRRELSVPKDRAAQPAYPFERPPLLQNAYRWLWLAVLGLPLAGLGALVFAPLAAVAALVLGIRTASRSERILSLVVVMLAGGLWLGGLLLGAILLAHFL